MEYLSFSVVWSCFCHVNLYSRTKKQRQKMSRINQRIDFNDKESQGREPIKSKKVKSMPPENKKQANLILDRLYEYNPILSLTCKMSVLTGLRYSDASWLKYSDFYDEFGNFRPQITVVQQKTYRMRVGRKKKPTNHDEAVRKSSLTVYTNSEIEELVKDTRYFSDGGGFLFSNRRSRKVLQNDEIVYRPMSVESADKCHVKVKKDLKLNFALGTHSWRKMFAQLLLDNGTSIEKIRDLLGHSSLVSTNAYLSSFSKDLKEQIQQISLAR